MQEQIGKVFGAFKAQGDRFFWSDKNSHLMSESGSSVFQKKTERPWNVYENKGSVFHN